MTEKSKIWIVRHFNIGESQDESESDEIELSQKIIGYYSSEVKALQAIERLKSKEGFRSYPGGFRVYDAVVDQDLWRSGFIENP